MKPTPTEVTHALLAWAIEREDRSFSGGRAAAALRMDLDASEGQVRRALTLLLASRHLYRARFGRARYSWMPPSERRGFKTKSDRRAEDQRAVAKCLGLLRIAGVCDPFVPSDGDDFDERNDRGVALVELRLSGKEAAKLAALLTILASGGP
jgi:hypothetical protein